MRDAFEALEHLGRFDFVDRQRIAALGSSQGGRAAYQLTSGAIARVYSPTGARFVALVSLYGECFNRPTKRAYVPNDAKWPLLALLGARDEDGGPRECPPRFEAAKAAGAPYEWHVFPNTGHVWDVPKFDRRRYVDYSGAPSGRVLFEYDEKATAESKTRIFTFLAVKMPRR